MSDTALAELGAAADGMVDALQRLKALIEGERRPETTAASSSRLIQPAALLDGVRASAERARARHRGTELVVHEPAPELRALRVAVCAGERGLSRALDALLENACSGDGERDAGRVEVSIGARLEVDVVALEIADDGPGFTQTELGQAITAFETTKRGALGLGLYTAERIARASGGSLRRANREGDGAIVSVFLPVAPEPRAPQ
jgi:signal transduction histidine kinase